MPRTSRSCAPRTASPSSLLFNYKEFVKSKNLKQNIDLKPGDTIIVP